MKKLEISLSDDEWEQLRLAVTIEQKKIVSDTETMHKAEELMTEELKRFTNALLKRLDVGTMR
jgi:hypothetical protein